MFRTARERNLSNNGCLLPLLVRKERERWERELLIKQNKFINKVQEQHWHWFSREINLEVTGRNQFLSVIIPLLPPLAIATHSGKHTHSGGQCRSWSAVYYTHGPKAEPPLSQGPWPVFVKNFYTLSVRAQTHLPKFPETSLIKGKERYKVNPRFLSVGSQQWTITNRAVAIPQ